MTMIGTYSYWLVTVSILIAILASYAALDLAGRVTAAEGRVRLAWLGGGAIAMGFGIWSMHYIGMLAFTLPVPVSYDWPIVMVSLIAAILASGVALFVASRQEVSLYHVIAGGMVMGAGITAMHYNGMAAMRLEGMCHYNPGVVTLSVILAILVSMVAIWLSFSFRGDSMGAGWRKIVSAVVMGAAIPLMHYTGMAAASFTTSPVQPETSHAVSISTLGLASIIIVTLMIIGVAIITSMVDRRFSARTMDLRSSEDYLRTLMDNLPDLVYFKDLKSRFIRINQAHARAFGLSNPAKAVRKTDFDFFTADHAQKAFNDEQEIIRTAIPILGKVEKETWPGGRETWASTTKLPLRNASGTIIGTFGVSRDITANKGIEAENARLAGIVNSTDDGIFSSNREGLIKTWNAGAERMYGYTAEEIKGKHITTLIPEDRRGDVALNQEKLYRGEGVLHYDQEHLRKDGSRLPVTLTLSPIRNAAGVVTGVSVISHDITEKKRADEELQRAKEAAESASRAKSEFLANMSHEIRTPINAIVGMTDMALDTDLTPEQREYLTTVKGGADSLLTLINDILDFSKIEAGKLEIDKIDFPLRETLENILRTLALRAHEKSLELACRVMPDIPDLLVGDPDRLKQILINLVGNAIKFTFLGEVIVNVVAESRTDEKVDLHFAVKDTGIGIPAAKQEIIFSAFTQADASTTRQFGGTGLGLAIVKRLVEMMGGRLWLESEVARGSTFHFTLPFPLNKEAVVRPAPADTSQLTDLPVLIVDDNATNRRILEEMLSKWSMRPFSVESGPEALAMVDAAVKSGQPFPLMIVDVNMPGMDGFEVAERVSHNPSLHGATIMMLSSASRPGDVSRCKDVGVSAYLMKPVRRGELLEAILDVLGGRVESIKRVRTSKKRSANERRRGISILLAEDNPVNQIVALRLLEKQKHRVQAVGNGHESLLAMEKTAYQGFDLILMDVQMPEMDGLAATAAIRQKERDLGTGLHIPIVAMTAYAMKGDKERCLAAGMDAYLSKPINIQQLLDIIELLTGSRGEAPLQAPPSEAMNKDVLDKQAILAAFEGDDELIKEVLGLFLQECPRQMSAIREAVESHDAERIFRAAHSLKGSLSNFAAAGAFQSAQYLERLGREGELAKVGSAYQVLEEQVGVAVPGDDGVEQGVRPMKILVTDDDPINRRLLEAFLVKNDYQGILAREKWSRNFAKN